MSVVGKVALRPPIPPNLNESARNDEALRRRLVSVLLVAAQILNVSIETRFTAACLLHHYMNANTDAEVNWKWAIAACLFLACKTEEEPRRLRDVINCAHMISWEDANENTSKCKGIQAENGTIEYSKIIPSPCTLEWNPDPPELNEDYWRAKETIVATEQKILRWLAFDPFVSHPHRAVVLLVQELITNASSVQPLLIETAWTILNNAVFSPAALQHPVLHMAAAAVEIAMARHQKDVSQDLNVKEWYRDIGIEESDVNSARKSLAEAEQKLVDI